MNTKAAILTIFAVGTAWVAMGVDATPKDKPPVSKEKVSYAIGVNIGNNFKRQDVEVDFDQLLRGMKDAVAGSPAVTEAEIRETLTQFQQEMATKQQEKRRQLGEKNKADGEAFLAENKSKPGVITLTNGLQYKVVTEGTGETPKADDIVEVNYRGTFIDGSEFDSSAKAGRPLSTRVTGGIIRGWTEALTRMKVGSKWQIFIPSDLAYGEFGKQPNIGPNTTLVFDLELLSAKAPPPPPPAAAPLTSDIIKVPSAEEMKKGAKIETLKAEDVERMIKEQQAKEGKPKQ